MKASFPFQQGQIGPGSSTWCTEELSVETNNPDKKGELTEAHEWHQVPALKIVQLFFSKLRAVVKSHILQYLSWACAAQAGRTTTTGLKMFCTSYIWAGKALHKEWLVIMGWGCMNWSEAWLQQRAVIHKCWHSPFCTALTNNTEAYP